MRDGRGSGNRSFHVAATLRQLHVVSMARRVPLRFLFKVSPQRGTKIDIGLIGQTDGDKQDIGEFVRQVAELLARLTGLFTTATRKNSRDLAHLFDELGEIRQLIEVANTNGLNPIVDRLLRASDR